MSAALPDTTNAKSTSGSGQTALPLTLCTCAVTDTDLFALEGNRTAGLQVPTSVTYNGVGLTSLGSINDGVNSSVSIWHMPTPPTGSALTLAANYASGTQNAIALAFIPYSGVVSIGALVTAFSAANNNPAVTGTGGGANDSYLAVAFNNDTAETGGGVGNQLVTAAQQANINTLCTADFNHILGSNAGAASWTGSGVAHGTNWAALMLLIKGAAAGGGGVSGSGVSGSGVSGAGLSGAGLSRSANL